MRKLKLTKMNLSHFLPSEKFIWNGRNKTSFDLK